MVDATSGATPCSDQLRSTYHAETCDAAQPAWVARYSSAADGPEQRWINFGQASDEMVIGWITANTAATSTVEYGTTSGEYDSTAEGTSTTYTYGSYESGLIHHVTLSGLLPKTKYFYRVGDAATGYSDEANFTSGNVGPHYPYVIGAFADIGESANAEATVAHLLENSDIDAFVLNGDISYANGCEANGCETWNAFQRMMDPVAAFRPISVEIGNHEEVDNANGIVVRVCFLPHGVVQSYNCDVIYTLS